MSAKIPEKPALEGLEEKWRTRWEADGTYRFDRRRSRAEVFSIDTPPPTVSGRLHIGHVFSYTHTDLVARYQRMAGKEVFYPIGWDDNGLNVERRVQLMTGTMVDPTLPYEPDFVPPQEVPKRPLAVSRPNFIELCQQIVPEMEAEYHELWARLGLSIDWSFTYTTIGTRATKVSQSAFLRLLADGVAYRAEAPTLWDVDLRTAVAQAELEDREIPGVYQRLVFTGPDGSDLLVDTTRPELLPACVALVAHPEDARYRHLFGQQGTTPLFGVSVPIVAHRLGDPEKGTGLAMICTFGDATDVVWWRELGLATRALVQRDGTMREIEWGSPGFESADPGGAQAAYAPMSGRSTKQAKEIVTNLLAEAGKLAAEPRPITHSVKFWENGTRPLEIVTSDQWFIRYPDAGVLIELGREINWVPDFMRIRYENWVNGLTGDWNITRQRYFGVPFPVWYRIDEAGAIDHSSPIVPETDSLPIDPSTDVPTGYEPEQRNQPGGFAGDGDVMDTWATSSLSPLIICGYDDDPDLFARTYPMDLRPQAHEIIRTWLFSTVVRAYYEFGAVPWRNAAISGFVIDPDRKKLSKSAGNSPNDPVAMLDRFGADAVRYWAAQGRPGTDMAFDEGQLKIGRRLATKVLNASRFVLGLTGEASGQPSEALDVALLAELADLVDETTVAFERFDYARVLERTEEFFWPFCDDYLELVKSRAYAEEGEPGRSARVTLAIALESLLKLFAPFLPYVTEEVWSWWKEGSIHRSPWPRSADIRPAGTNVNGLLGHAGQVLSGIRKAKTGNKASMKAEVAALTVKGPTELINAVALIAADVRSVANLSGDLSFEEDDQFDVIVELAGSSAGGSSATSGLDLAGAQPADGVDRQTRL